MSTASAPAGRSFGTRLAAVLAGELVNKASVMVAFVWLAHTLDPAAYGEIEWALSLLMVFTLVADAGLATWGAAEVAAHPAEAASLIRRVGTLRLALAVPSYGVLLAIAASYGGRAGAALSVYGLVLFFTPLFLQYLFNGLFQSHWAALGNALRGLTFAIAVLLFVRTGSAPWTIAAAEVAGAAMLALCSWLLLGRTLRPIPQQADRPTGDLRGILARSRAIGATEVTWGVHWYAGLILLGYLASPTDAAWHSAALRLVMALHTGVWLYLYVLLPNLARLIAADHNGWRATVQQSMRLTGWAGWAVALIGTLAADTLFRVILGEPFVAAAPVLQAAIWVVPVAWLSGHIRYSLIAAGRPGLDYRAGLIGAGTTILLSVILIPPLRSLGTGLALLGGTVANAIAAFVLARGVLPPVAVTGSARPSVLWGAGALLAGLALRPHAGGLSAAALAVAAFGAAALITERHTARRMLGTLTGAGRLGVRNADVRP